MSVFVYATSPNFATTIFRFCWNQPNFLLQWLCFCWNYHLCCYYYLSSAGLAPILLPPTSICAGTNNLFCYHYIFVLPEPAPILLSPALIFVGTSNFFCYIQHHFLLELVDCRLRRWRNGATTKVEKCYNWCINLLHVAFLIAGTSLASARRSSVGRRARAAGATSTGALLAGKHRKPRTSTGSDERGVRHGWELLVNAEPDAKGEAMMWKN